MKKIILVLLALVITVGTAFAKAEKEPKGTILMVVAKDDFNDEEYFTARKAFEKAGYRTVTVSNVKTKLFGMEGKELKPDFLIGDIDYSTGYDAIVIAGGKGARENLWNNTQLLRITNNFVIENKVTAAIDQATVVLGQAGALSGKKAAASREDGAPDMLKASGAVFVAKGVVVSGMAVTAAARRDSVKFAKAVLKLLKKNKKQKGEISK